MFKKFIITTAFIWLVGSLFAVTPSVKKDIADAGKLGKRVVAIYNTGNKYTSKNSYQWGS